MTLCLIVLAEGDLVGLSMVERRAVTKQMLSRYEKASKAGKGQILDELCALTGWTRRHTRRALQSVGSVAAKKPRPPRVRIYNDEVLGVLRKVWSLAGGPCGKRLAPFLPALVTALERHGELVLEPSVREKLIQMSAATIDRTLKSERARLQVRGRHGTKPGTLLRQQIPIRTFAEWSEDRPGFCEVDLVAHSGEIAAGDFCQTLDFTDVCSGWTEMRAVLNKAQRWVHEAIDTIANRLPFPLQGIDSDNGSEFINDELDRYCIQRKITFTRTRPYRKNDNCYVEQKNWTHVRQMVGYHRYEGAADVKLLNELYDVLRLWFNFFNPQQKLVSKTRSGARVTRRYDTAATPHQRLLASPHLDRTGKQRLTREYEALNPAELSRQIGRLQKELTRRAGRRRSTRIPKKGGLPARPNHPWTETFSMKQRKELSRTS